VTVSAVEQVATPYLSPEWTSPLTASSGGDFGSMLLQGVSDTDARVQSAEAKVAAFATGENIPPHQVMLALEDARMSLEFALQIRSKLVEGYQELMRMQL
jgi:flagellar hook-basal body complex protein FliE